MERDAFSLMDFPIVILLVDFCTDPQSCFLAVWFFAIELPKLIRKFHLAMKLGILLLENGSIAVWIRQMRSRSLLISSCFFFGYSLLMIVLYLTKALPGQSHSSVDSLFCTLYRACCKGLLFYPAFFCQIKGLFLTLLIQQLKTMRRYLWTSSADRNDNIPEIGKYAFLF